MQASKIILTGQKSRTLHKEELTMSSVERSVKKRVEENARVMQNKRSSNSKSPMTTPTSKSPPYSKTTPTSKIPPSSIPKSPSSKALEKRIRVTSSDGRTCNLKLDLSVTYVQLQEAIEQELR